ncbi:hypothetical protein Gohar_015171, partial [Gossypium harknessii]|nr:hypothetical protein [Gossypium harknessii]
PNLVNSVIGGSTIWLSDVETCWRLKTSENGTKGEGTAIFESGITIPPINSKIRDHSSVFHEWREFCIWPQRPAVTHVVLEFYANLKFANDDKVYVKGKEVEVSPSKISKYYKAHLYENDERKGIYVGTWIYKFTLRCVIRDEVRIFFPHLVIDLCRAAEMPVEPLKPFYRPTKYVIGDSIYKKIQGTPARAT